MSKNAERILWSVLLLALGVSLFLIFSPAGKAIINNELDNLWFTGASQVSDFEVSPKMVIDNN